MDRLQSYVLHGFSPRLFSAGVVTVWRRNIEVWWIIFRPKNISFQSFILTQPQDSYSCIPLSVDRHGVLTALLFARLGFLDLFSKSENIFLSGMAEKKASNLLCDGIRQSKDHQAEDKSHASKDPRNDVDLLLQLLLLICL